MGMPAARYSRAAGRGNLSPRTVTFAVGQLAQAVAAPGAMATAPLYSAAPAAPSWLAAVAGVSLATTRLMAETPCGS
jgi:hypothetical protein